MPTLNWIGKDAVVDHHRKVPTRLLECDPKLSFGDPDAENLLVEGDNLEALKALLPRYRGQVKCIYIDPPYNTGNENWVYNDNVNDPRIRKWLGSVVGKEAEDLCRHDKWLCMMYPRLAMLREFLTDDGVIFVSLDDNEVQNLRAIMDEIFGQGNFITTVIWQKVYSPKNSARHFSEDHDYIVVYAKKADQFVPNLIARTAEQDAAYKNPDDDPRGVWKTSDLSARNYYGDGTYSLTCPSGRVIESPPKGRYWSISKERFEELDKDNRIWWGRSGGSIPQMKRFLTDVKQGRVPQTLWTYQEVGHTQAAKKELVAICDFDESVDVFITPKPTSLIQRVLEIGSDENSIIMDSFAGSGTTGQAVLAANKADGGSRKCVLVEVLPDVAEKVTRQRLQRVSEGYTDPKGNDVEGLGSGFRYCKLGRTLLDEYGDINGDVPFPDLARYVFLLETGVPVPKRPRKDCPLLGVHRGSAIYLLYNGVLGDRRPAGGNVLTHKVLSELPSHPDGDDSPRVIFGESTLLSDKTLSGLNVTFRQIPYELRES
ncbi:site-specific DNA-methyltransferase (adenine-specific)/adenine-specific DNA-methyltransferase [Rhodopirellula rubra]|uniref:site-specific DNA-methyltransferase (adenine-specific) n=1 Tax=Aporhodopirellula rubra TaxID=980271 RepID=A0A7W5H4F2_9BACT|nr:site-specific DNA-methyltransferase [Aporhodopirellula rubra]MBB3205103.1 site-specific DNA-methyltransferase (adenine-specific)/adenine-specific DNA-methyltransferase [Aporhodopirellula rubra]